jgi:hypothetical protein
MATELTIVCDYAFAVCNWDTADHCGPLRFLVGERGGVADPSRCGEAD